MLAVILPIVDSGQLLNDLCVQLGFCLPPIEQQRIVRFPAGTVDAFTDDVIVTEGLNPVTIDSMLRTAVRTRVARHFEAAERIVRDAEEQLGVLVPEPVRVLYAASDGRRNDAGQWDVVWPMARVVEENRRAWAERTLPREMLAFGDDGTGAPFCVSLATHRDEVLRWNWIDAAVETGEGTVEDFSSKWL